MSGEGRPILAYTCGRAPVELIEAAGFEPRPLPLLGPAAPPRAPDAAPGAATLNALHALLAPGSCRLVRESCRSLAGAAGVAGALVASCCHPAARLADALAAGGLDVAVFAAALPRRRDAAAIRWLAAEFETLLGALLEAPARPGPHGPPAASLAAAVIAWEHAAAAYSRLATVLPVLPAGAAPAALEAVHGGGGGEAVATALDRVRVAALVASSRGGMAAPRQPGVLLSAQACDAAALARAVEEAGGRVVALDACIIRRLSSNGALPAGPPPDGGARRRRPAGLRRTLVNIARRTVAADCPATSATPRRARALRALAGECGAALAVLAADPNCVAAAYELPFVAAVLEAAGLAVVKVGAPAGAGGPLGDHAREVLEAAMKSLR